MKRPSVALSLLLVVSLVIVAFGCAAGEPEEMVPEGPVPLPSEKARKDVSVDDSYAGKEAEVAVGGSFTAHLKSDPATGFEWELAAITDQTVLGRVHTK